MKNQVLSIEQMQKLKDLGVDTTKASMVLLFQDDESNIYDWDEVVEECSEFGDCFQHFIKDDEGNHNMVYMSLLDAERGNYDHSYREDCTVFTLQDIIDLLPKSISHKYEVLSKTYEDTYALVWDMEGGVLKYCDDIGCEREYTNHAIIHVNEIGVLESLYEMLVWVAENGYLTSK